MYVEMYNFQLQNALRHALEAKKYLTKEIQGGASREKMRDMLCSTEEVHSRCCPTH